MKFTKLKLVLETSLLGISSAVIYFLLYYFEGTVLGWSQGFKKEGWFFIGPIIIALVFSVVHGSFTSRFWELLGIRAKERIK